GRHVAVVQALCSDRGVLAGRLMLLDADDEGSVVVDTGGADVSCVRWIDERRLGYFGQRNLESVCGVVSMPTRSAEELHSSTLSLGGGRYPDGMFTPAGDIVFIRSAYQVPPEVVLVRAGRAMVLASTKHSGTTRFLARVGTAAPLSWHGPDGLEIE